MAKKSKITRDRIADDNIFTIGEDYAKSLKPAIDANKEYLGTFEDLKKAALAYANIEKEFKKTGNKTEFLKVKEKEKQLAEQATVALEKQNQAQIKLEAANQKRAEQQRLAEIRLAQQREKAFDNYEKQLQREEAAKKKAIETQLKQNREYNKLLTALNNVRNDAKDVAAQMFNLEREGKKNTDAYSKLDAEFKRLSKTTNILDRGIKDIDKSLGQHQREVGNYKIATENLHPALGRVNSQLAMMGLSLDTLAGQGGFRAVTGALIAFGRATLAFLLTPVGAALAILGGLYALIRSNKDTVIEFDRQLTNVGKTTGLAGDELSGLGDDIVLLSRKLKVVGTPALLDYATVAGQLGVKGSENILAFTEALAKLETASNISGEEGAANIARLLTLTDGGVQNVGDFSDEIVKLGNNFAATESEILSNATAIGQNVAQYKFGRQDVLAFATATKAVGVEAEMTGSTLGRTLGLMERALRTGQNVQILADVTGKSVVELQQIFKQDSAQALQLLVKGLNDVSKAGGSVNEQLQEIGITSVRDQRVISSLATKGFDVLELAIQDVRTATGALDQEFGAAANNLENRLSKFGTAWDNLVLSIEDGNGVFSQFFAILSESGAWVLDLITNRFNDFNTILNSGESVLTKYASAAENLILPLKWLNQLRGRDNETIAKEIRLREENIAKIKEEWSSRKDLTTVLLENAEAREEDFYWLLRGVDANKDETEVKRTLRIINQELAEENEKLLDASKEEIPLIQKKIKELEKERDARIGVTKSIKESVEAVKGSVFWFRQNISRLEELRDKTALTQEQTAEYNKAINQLKYDLEQLEGITLRFGEAMQAMSWDELENVLNPAEVIDEQALNNFLENARKKAEEFQNKLLEIRETFATLPSILGINNDAFVNLFIGLTEGFDTFGDQWDQLAVKVEAFGEIAIGVINQITASQNARFQSQISDLEREKQIQIEQAGESAEGRKRIEEEFDRKKRQIQKKQAESNKRTAIFESIMATALAVVKALPNVFLAAAVGALGLIQTGIIASTPIPQYFKGTDNHPGGLAEVAEVRPEVIQEPRKKPYLVKQRSILNLPKGTKVTPSLEEYQAMMKASLVTSIQANNQNLRDFEVKQLFDKNSDAILNELILSRKIFERFKPYIIHNTKAPDLNHEIFRNKFLG